MSDSYDWEHDDKEILERLRRGHEHWCDACIDAWAHIDDDCDIAAAYECPEHQPRSGTFYESFASTRS